MHDTDKEGNEFFKCDFCRQAWAEDRPMVEGHQGSLICGPCLTIAYRLVHLQQSGMHAAPEQACTLCKQHQETLHWQSPAFDEAIACARCIKQSSRVLQKDVESGWKIPAE